MAQQRTYGSALSALETSYINLCLDQKAYGYIDEKIDQACIDGDLYIILSLNEIPANSEKESVRNEDFLIKMASVFTGLGYDFKSQDKDHILISWSKPYYHTK